MSTFVLASDADVAVALDPVSRKSAYFQTRYIYDAIQFTRDNRDKILDFLGVKKDLSEFWMNMDNKECYLLIMDPKVNIGKILEKDWILCGRAYVDYKVVNDEMFRASWQAIKD